MSSFDGQQFKVLPKTKDRYPGVEEAADGIKTYSCRLRVQSYAAILALKTRKSIFEVDVNVGTNIVDTVIQFGVGQKALVVPTHAGILLTHTATLRSIEYEGSGGAGSWYYATAEWVITQEDTTP